MMSGGSTWECALSEATFRVWVRVTLSQNWITYSSCDVLEWYMYMEGILSCSERRNHVTSFLVGWIPCPLGRDHVLFYIDINLSRYNRLNSHVSLGPNPDISMALIVRDPDLLQTLSITLQVCSRLSLSLRRVFIPAYGRSISIWKRVQGILSSDVDYLFPHASSNCRFPPATPAHKCLLFHPYVVDFTCPLSRYASSQMPCWSNVQDCTVIKWLWSLRRPRRDLTLETS